MTRARVPRGHRGHAGRPADVAVIAPARLAAYDVLRAVGSGRADLPAALARARTALHDERDRALAGEIATGTLRWQGAFDRRDRGVCRAGPPRRLDPEVLDILRLTAVPAAASRSRPGVRRRQRCGRARGQGGQAQRARRSSTRCSGASAASATRLPLPPRPADPADRAAALAYLSSTLSHPRVARARAGSIATASRRPRAWARFDNRPAPLTLRANTLADRRATRWPAALATHGVATEPDPLRPGRPDRAQRQSRC